MMTGLSSKKIPFWIEFIIFYCLLASANVSVTFGQSFWIEFAVAFICFIYFYSINALRCTDATILASFFLILCWVYSNHGGSFVGYVAKFMQVSLAVVLLNLKNVWRIELLETISKWFASLLAVSIIAWIIHFIIPLPHTTSIIWSPWGGTEYHHNYYLFIIVDKLDHFQRFQSFFLEPGHLGTIVSFFLIVNRFDFKKRQNLIFLLCIILSMSASAFVLSALGYLLFKYLENGNMKFLMYAFVATFLMIFFTYYNGGDNIINNIIFSKLNRDSGAIEGRVSIEILSMYNEMLSSGQDLIFGKTAFLDVEAQGAGIILYFVQNGIIGVVLLIVAYLSIYLSCRSKYGFVVFIVYLVSFLQRTYPQWDAFSLPFILGLAVFAYKEKKLKTVIRY